MLKALLMSLGMFSILPVPKRCWDDRRLPWLVPLMPVVGALIGGLWYAVAFFSIGLPPLIQAAAVLLTPFVLSGCFHLDGYMDTADAVFSRRELEEKKRILKDSHVGAFAVIALVFLLLAQFCAVQTVLETKKSLTLFLFLPVVSRGVVGMALLRMKPMSESGFAAMMVKNAGQVHFAFLSAAFVTTGSVAFFVSNNRTVAALFVEAVAALGVMLYLRREFQGISGDLCGCAITLSELAALLTLAILSV